MFQYFIRFTIYLNLLLIGGNDVKGQSSRSSSLFCGEPTIDSIAFANDLRMFFISVGGYYWWAKEEQLPPKDEHAVKLPSPFKRATAAVYVNSLKGCTNPRSGMRPNQSEIWITDLIDGKLYLMSFDVSNNRWSEPIPRAKDHCISGAKIDLSTIGPINAMFSRNYLDIFVVKGSSYAMVNCTFLCSDPTNRFGEDKPPNNITDWETNGPIHGMYISIDRNTKEEKLMIFQKKTYSSLRMEETKDGRIIAKKTETTKEILTNFLKFDKNKCKSNPTDTVVNTEKTSSTLTPQFIEPFNTKEPVRIKVTIGVNTEGPKYQNEEQPSLKSVKDKDDNKDDEVGGGALLILIVLFIVILIALVIFVFLVVSVQKTTPEESRRSNSQKSQNIKSEVESKVPLSPTERSTIQKSKVSRKSEVATNKAKIPKQTKAHKK